MTTAVASTGAELIASPMPLYQLALGFMGTRVLLAAHRLGVFKSLAERPQTAAELAGTFGFSQDATEMLLDACAALRLCVKNDGRYETGPLVRQYLVSGSHTYLGHFFDHFADHMYPAWDYLEETIRTGQAQMNRVIGKPGDAFFQALDRDSSDLDTFMQTMEEHSLLEGAAVASAYDFSTHQHLCDVAGGTGAMSVAIIRRFPHLRSTVLERPSACPGARRAIAAHGLSNQIGVIEGDMFVGPYPPDADLLLLSGTLHNWGPDQAQQILNRCRQALAAGGTLLISEQVMDDDKISSPLGPLCSLNMFVMMGGREYTQSEYRHMLSAAGFELIEVRPTMGVRHLLIAR